MLKTGPHQEKPLSLSICAACKHSECYHDQDGCFVGPSGKTPDEYPSPDSRKVSKEMGAECWCPGFVSDALQAIDPILQSGNREAMKRGVLDALDRGDHKNAVRLRGHLILRNFVDERDAHWLDETNRRITELPEEVEMFPDSRQHLVQRIAKGAMTASVFWRDLESRFRALKPPQSDGLSAEWISTTWNDSGEQWYLRGSNDKRLHACFNWTAERAALELGHTGAQSAVFFWLDLLKRDSPNFLIDSHGVTNLPDGGVRHNKGGTIHRVCEASADYCFKLENEAVASLGDRQHRRADIVGATKVRSGRPPRLASGFVEFAGKLWLEAKGQSVPSRSSPKLLSKVKTKGLATIASILDNQGHIPPAKYLEGRYADELRSFNSRNSNSKSGAIKTWSQLVALADKDHVRGMRRLLSRCAEKSKLVGLELSGK